jgi:inhibitor of cysteine peptidase
MRKVWTIGGLLIVAIIFIIGKGMLPDEKHTKVKTVSLPVVEKEDLPVVGSRENLNNYFLELIKQQKQSPTLFGQRESAEKMTSGLAADSSALTNKDVSKTNNQVEGVDEADLVKTDGNHIFYVNQNKVNVIKAIPAGEMKQLATITFDQTFTPAELFLHKDQLVVIGYSYENIGTNGDVPMEQLTVDSSMKIAPMNQSTKAIVYNISNPEKPAAVREMKLEGSYVSSRKMNGIVYLVSNHYPNYWLLEANEAVDIRPKYSDSLINNEMKPVDYQNIQYFPDSKEANYTMIAAFDLEKPEKEAAITTYLGSGNQLYMSMENLYLAVPKPFSQPIEDMTKMVAPDTNVYKFSVKDMEVKFHSSTEIQGMILNQFSMDEHKGNFRVVTTKGFTWDENQPSTNQLNVFDENLKKIGELSDLAKGERIYSARFLGDRIYMVTYKETDPLFVIDASEPTNPKVLGELKIPGFSNYLHPYDENHIIGFGQETKLVTEKEGPPRLMTNGVKITLFDVSDLSNPKEKFTEIIGGRGTYSLLNHDHKALLFNKNTNLFAFPISVYRNNPASEYEQIFEYQGAYIYNIDPTLGFSLKSKITHQTGVSPYETWENSINRLLYIGDNLYTLSPEKISAHDLTTYQQLSELSLKEF